MKTIINGIQSWTKKEIKEEVGKIPVVHSNWNEKNTNSFSYIKNRPFYDDSDRIIVYEAKNITWNTRSISNDYVRATEYYYDPPYIDLIPNKEYGILIDGKEYIGVAEDHFDDGIWIQMHTDTGSVFEILNYGHIGYNDYGNTGRPDVNFIIFEKTSKTKSINVKFLPQDLLKSMEDIAIALSNKMAYTNPVGTGSFSINRKNNTIIGTGSVAIGPNTTASGVYSYAEGCQTQATKDTSATTTTTTSTVTGYATHAEGYGTVASGAVSHAEGNGTKSSGSYSHAEGHKTTASGNSSHAEGKDTTASGQASHTEGYLTKATNNFTHAEGVNTTASGVYSHAEGSNTLASGSISHAEGYYVIAASTNQHAQGKYNLQNSDNTLAHIVGNGTSTTARSNAHTLDWEGNAWFARDVYVGSTSGTNRDDGSERLLKMSDKATDDDALNLMMELGYLPALMTTSDDIIYTNSDGVIYTL